MPKCSGCGKEVQGTFSKMVFNIKCPDCRKTPDRNQKATADTETHVACRKCGLLRKSLSRHLRTSHDMSTDAYMTEFPGALLENSDFRLRSEECRQKQSAAATRRWSDAEELAAQSERLKGSAPWRGKTLSAEHRRAISLGGSGVAHDLSPEYRQALGVRGRATLAEVRQHPGYGGKLSKAQKGRWQELGSGHPLLRPESRRKSIESKIRNGTLSPKGSGRGITGFRKGIAHYCRSTLEANFARILLLEGIPYEYEPTVFTLPGGGHWTPDFKLLKPLGDLVPAGWVELKGWGHKDGTLPLGANEKIAAFEKMTGEKVFVIRQDQYLWKQIAELYATRVPWETPQQNLRSHPDVFGKRAA